MVSGWLPVQPPADAGGEHEYQGYDEAHGKTPDLIGCAMLRRAWRFVRDNVGAVVSVLSIFGFGSAVAALDDARAMLAEHTGAALLLMGLAFALGIGFSDYVLSSGKRARRRQKLDRLTRVFAAMPKSQREFVAAALDGTVRTATDSTAGRTLCEDGILRSAPAAWTPGVSEYTVDPDVVLEIREHRDEWLSR